MLGTVLAVCAWYLFRSLHSSLKGPAREFSTVRHISFTFYKYSLVTESLNPSSNRVTPRSGMTAE